MPTASKELMSVRIQVTLFTGEDLMTGKPTYRNQSLSKVREDVTAREAYDVVEAVYDLQKHMIYNIQQIDVSELNG